MVELRDFFQVQIYVKPMSTGAMFNQGIKVSRGQILAFTGADCIVSNNWLSVLIEGFSDSTVIGTGGNILIDGKACFDLKARGLTDINGFILLESRKFFPKGSICIPSFLGANCAFRRSVIDKEGGYMEAYSEVGCEDVELCVRLLLKGYKIKFVNTNIYHPSRSFKSGWQSPLFSIEIT